MLGSITAHGASFSPAGRLRQLPDHARHRADGLDAARVRATMALLSKFAFPRSARRWTGARRRSKTRSTRPSAPARRPTSCSPSTASGSRRRAHAGGRDRRSAPARRPRSTSTRPRRRAQERERSCSSRRRARHRGRDAAGAGRHPEVGTVLSRSPVGDGIARVGTASRTASRSRCSSSTTASSASR
jgi:hypothetical protein